MISNIEGLLKMSPGIRTHPPDTIDEANPAIGYKNVFRRMSINFNLPRVYMLKSEETRWKQPYQRFFQLDQQDCVTHDTLTWAFPSQADRLVFDSVNHRFFVVLVWFCFHLVIIHNDERRCSEIERSV